MFDFKRSQNELPLVSAVHNDQTWDQNELQFMRLLAVMRQHLTAKQLKTVAKNMRLEHSDIDALLDRAELAWGEVLERTFPDGYFPQMFEKELPISEFGSYAQDAPAEVLQELATHLVTFELDHEVGGAAMRVAPEMIDPLQPSGLTVGLTIQQGMPQLFITPTAGDAICIALNKSGELYQIDMDAELDEPCE
ncbi:hypothetical protein [Gulbenkiania mobilis]|uniref:hypothetical protein n=1 Tax=Gulbenkiania mobilis TaxID=397457 RepID=UPI0006BC0BAC|nr:hypothetical protein [Gulbenkiania mobilis]